MNIRARVGKLEAAIGHHRPLYEWSDAELEDFLRRTAGGELEWPANSEITDEMLGKLLSWA